MNLVVLKFIQIKFVQIALLWFISVTATNVEKVEYLWPGDNFHGTTVLGTRESV